MNGPYDNLVSDDQDSNEGGRLPSVSTKISRAAAKTKRGKIGGRCAAASVAFIVVAIAASAALNGWAFHVRLRQSERDRNCKYATFVLDSGSLESCGQPRLRPTPCRVNDSAWLGLGAYLTAEKYNNAVGPWKIDSEDSGDEGQCEFQFERLGTHLVIKQSGLYQLTGQVTFTDDRPAYLEWQVGHAEWIAASRSREPGAGPTQMRLEAVRRLIAGEKLSLHLDHGERRLAIDPEATQFTLSRL